MLLTFVGALCYYKTTAMLNNVDLVHLQETWVQAALNHPVGVCDWGLTGGCNHPEDWVDKSPKAFLEPGGPAHKALRKIITDPHHQRKFAYFVNARLVLSW